jgi:hypothetical protein
MERKMVPLYRDKREMELWEKAENIARQEHSADSEREGKILAQICAAYLGAAGPLDGEKA